MHIFYVYYYYAGNFSRINVEITDRRNVIFTIELGVRYTQEVRLSLLYTNAMNTSQTEEVRTSTVVKNGTNISHFECGGQVPFTKFRVQVRLMFPEDIYGPYHVLHDVYGKETSNYCIRCCYLIIRAWEHNYDKSDSEF